MLTQVYLLFNREILNLKRDVVSTIGRFGITMILGILVAIIFKDVGRSDSAIPSNINSHFGAILMIAFMGMFSTAAQALLSFPQERPVFLREYTTNHYSTLAYFMSRFSLEAFVTAMQVLVQVSSMMFPFMFYTSNNLN